MYVILFFIKCISRICDIEIISANYSSPGVGGDDAANANRL